MTTDLDHLEKLHAAAFRPPWRAETWTVATDDGDDVEAETILAPEEYPAEQVVAQVSHDTGAIVTPGLESLARANAIAIAAYHNAMPALIAELRELRAKLAKVTFVQVSRVAPGIVDFEADLESKEPQWKQVGETTFSAPLGAIGKCLKYGRVVTGEFPACARCNEDSR